MKQNFNITEIYSSVQGESSFSGLPCTFIRLTGCPLRCRWCDTVYGFEGGKEVSSDDILQQVENIGVNLVELTGGEPLAQKASFGLVDELIDRGYKVLIETGGSEPIEKINSKAHIIMDIKCPGSGMSDRNRLENLKSLKETDEIKFVVASRDDYLWAKEFILENKLDEKHQVLLSPAWGLCKPDELVEWLMSDKLNVRLNMQIHKYIWSPKKKGV